MPRSKISIETLRKLLRTQGFVPAQTLLRLLGISRASLSRLVAKHQGDVIRTGKTNQTYYGLLELLPSVAAQIPVFRVNETGTLEPHAKLLVIHSNHYLIEPGSLKYSGLPPELADMRPQGFMGRAFAQQYAIEIGIPSRIDDWSNQHILQALARRGEDLPGHFIIGQESAERWHRTVVSMVTRKSYPGMVAAALEGQPAGSSAGGEQPKFSVLRGDKNLMVKFAGTDDSKAQKRWRDLLICEALALQVLARHNVLTARIDLHLQGEMAFLEVERFDRIGARGRRSVLSLAALQDHFFGGRDTWSIAANTLLNAKLISQADAHQMKLLDAFGAWIADTDRHNHNIAFFSVASNDALFTAKRYKLAPAFDKLPMFYAPVGGQLSERKFMAPVLHAAPFDVWSQARMLALEFWELAAADSRISAEFRRIAMGCAKTVAGAS